MSTREPGAYTCKTGRRQITLLAMNVLPGARPQSKSPSMTMPLTVVSVAPDLLNPAPSTSNCSPLRWVSPVPMKLLTWTTVCPPVTVSPPRKQSTARQSENCAETFV